MSVGFPIELPDFLCRGPLGEIRFTGHRVDFHIVLYYLNEGYSEQMLVLQPQKISGHFGKIEL
jgi:hypothetical protein